MLENMPEGLGDEEQELWRAAHAGQLPEQDPDATPVMPEGLGDEEQELWKLAHEGEAN
ncbi:MAG: hypothetical protein HOB74_02095 [Candidatus Pacebacteria bacterium]|jgi:hypothetical protein|nr:hypothetical protein [Candidatus Paceibacterota bacterium]